MRVFVIFAVSMTIFSRRATDDTGALVVGSAWIAVGTEIAIRVAVWALG